MKKKILVISGTRAEFGLLESTITALSQSRLLKDFLLVTGMHTLKTYGYTLQEIKRQGFKISKIVPISQKGNMLLWLSEEIDGIYHYCQQLKPDCILVLGDRDEPLAGAIVGAHLGIPIAHIQGGDLSGDNVIDTKNRNAITQYATFHFPATDSGAKRVKLMVGESKNIKVVGAPGIDLLGSYKKLTKKEVSDRFSLNLSKKWILAVLHPCWINEVPFKRQIGSLIEALRDFEGEIVWIYPNSDEGSEIFINEIEKFTKTKNCKVFKNLSRENYVNILKNVDVMVGNSSSGIIESAFFHLPVVNIGNRQMSRERSINVINCGYNSASISKTIKKALSPSFKKLCLKSDSVYGNGQAGKLIVSTLEKIL